MANFCMLIDQHASPNQPELRMVVGELQNGRAAGATGLKAEHIKGWLANITQEEREDGGVD